MSVRKLLVRASLTCFLTALVYMNCWLLTRRAWAEPTYQECGAKYSGTCGTSNCYWIDRPWPQENACEHYHQVPYTGCVTTTASVSCVETSKDSGSQVCETRWTYIGASGSAFDCATPGNNCSAGVHINYFGNFFPACSSGKL